MPRLVARISKNENRKIEDASRMSGVGVGYIGSAMTILDYADLADK